MTPLQELAEISRGFTSGADRFYCVRDVTQRHLDSKRERVWRKRDYRVNPPATGGGGALNSNMR